jgi:hypothetical protein
MSGFLRNVPCTNERSKTNDNRREEKEQDPVHCKDSSTN